MGIFSGKIRGHHDYDPALITKWFIPKQKPYGNDYNGLGETVKRRPGPLMHGPDNHPWKGMMVWLLIKGKVPNPPIWFVEVRGMIRDKFGHKPIAPAKAKGIAEEFKKGLEEFAEAHPFIHQMGVTRMKESYMFAGQNDLSKEYPWVISVAQRMEYDVLVKNLEGEFKRSGAIIHKGYEETHVGAVDVANWIRAKGYKAKGYGGTSIIKGEWHTMIPPAIDGGIGQLAKNGSMISDKLGSAFRLSTTLTDMPLITDEPREIGVDEFCMSCKKCHTDCPPGAIGNEKQMVRGVEKWYVDFDVCMPYMLEQNGCAICVSTCPWSRPGVAPGLSKKMLKKMAAANKKTDEGPATTA